jgi:hypothetical protein
MVIFGFATANIVGPLKNFCDENLVVGKLNGRDAAAL